MSAELKSALSLTVPVGWSIVDLDGLLDVAASPDLLAVLFGLDDDFDGEAFGDELRVLRRRVADERLLFMGVRVREQADAFDVLTVAAPQVADPGHGASDAGAPQVGAERSAAYAESIFEGRAQLYEPPPRGPSARAWPTCIQVVMAGPPGVVVTLLSSRSGGESELRRDALAVAESLLGPPATNSVVSEA